MARWDCFFAEIIHTVIIVRHKATMTVIDRPISLPKRTQLTRRSSNLLLPIDIIDRCALRSAEYITATLKGLASNNLFDPGQNAQRTASSSTRQRRFSD